jgi:hypothetical protein
VRDSGRVSFAAILLATALAPSTGRAGGILIEYAGSTMWSGMGGASANGEYVYATYPNGLLVFHREGDTAITLFNELQVLPGSWDRVEALYNRAFLISDRNVLAMDLSDPSHPVPGGMYALPKGIDGVPVTIMGVDVVPQCTCVAIAYLGHVASDVIHINATDYNAPGVVGSYGAGADVWGMSAGGDFAVVFWFASPDLSGTYFVNISNPRAPLIVSWMVTVTPGDDYAFAGDVLGHWAYLLFNNDELGVVQIDSSSPPPIVSTLPFPTARGIRIEGDRAYVFSSDSGITTLTFADSTHPVSAGSASPPGSLRDIDGDMFYMGSAGSKLLMVDWSQPTAPVVLDSVSNAGPPLGFVSKRDTLAFVSSGAQGIQVINVRDVAHPERIASIPLSGSVGKSLVVQDYLYVVKADSSIDIVDISDLTAVAVVNNFRPVNHPVDLLLNGTVLIISVAESGLQLVSVADPANPTPINRIALPGYTASVALQGSYGCAAGSNPYLKLLDFTNPESPQLIGQYYFGSTSQDVMLADSIAYIADQYQGLLIVDARVPASPALIVQYPIIAPYPTVSVDRVGDYALVVRRREIHTLNISDPWNTVWEQEVATPGSVLHLLIDEPHIYVADGSGFTVLHVSGTTDIRGSGSDVPQDFSLGDNVPNPFNATTEIRYTLSRPQQVDLVIYNLLGRPVDRVFNGLQAAGSYAVTWDGHLDDGHDAPSGVYFYRLIAEGQSLTRKMLLLR